MKATIMLADAVQVSDGKLFILGGGWTVIGPDPSPMALAIRIEVPWDDSNRVHSYKVRLLTSDGDDVLVDTPMGKLGLSVEGQFEVGRPPGGRRGRYLPVPLALNIGPIPLVPGSYYVWKLEINDDSNELWEAQFETRPAG